jgi:PAS domain S-box-containing protein
MVIADRGDQRTTKRLLAQIVEVSGDAIFSENLRGRVTSWNTAAERLYGCAATDMLGRSTAELLPATTATQLRAVQALALSGERVDRFDTLHQRADGRTVAVSLTVSPLRGADGAIVGLATSVQDVSDRVQLSTELADAHRILEKHYKALARSNRDLEQFAYVASHDLSEPLRTMTGFVQLLEKRYDDAFDERGSRYLHHIVDGASRMRALIDDLLHYAQFLRADPPRTWVDTGAVARRVVGLLGPVDVEIEELPEVWCDEASVFTVFQNLLSNAMKFHRPELPIRIRVSGTRDGDSVHLLVDDDGIGIEPEYRERVFGMFTRLHVREAYAGTGIGLAIVQQIAERSDGSVWVERSPLGGCRFGISLPLPPPEQLAA